MIRRNGWMMLLAGLAVALSSASSVFAQGRGPGGFGGFGFGGRGGGAGGMMLLRSEAVQKDLGLSAEAVEKITKLAEETQGQMRAEMEKLTGGGGFQALQNLSDEQRQEFQKKMLELTQKTQEKTQAALKDVLNAEQQTRLKQIGWQVAGPQAINDAEVAKELNLTDDQKKQLAAAGEEATSKLRELGRGEGDQQERFAKMQEINKARDEKVAGVLTADQKAAFEKLKGKAFDVSQLRGGFGPGGGRPGRGPGGKPGAGRPGRPATEEKPEASK